MEAGSYRKRAPEDSPTGSIPGRWSSPTAVIATTHHSPHDSADFAPGSTEPAEWTLPPLHEAFGASPFRETAELSTRASSIIRVKTPVRNIAGAQAAVDLTRQEIRPRDEDQGGRLGSLPPCSESSELIGAAPARYGHSNCSRDEGTGHAVLSRTTLQSDSEYDPSEALPKHRDIKRWECCSPDCTGCRCATLRNIVREVVVESSILDAQLRSAPAGEARSGTAIPDVTESGMVKALDWVLRLLQWNNAHLQRVSQVTQAQVSGDTLPVESVFSPSKDQSGAMKRRHELAHKEEHDAFRRPQLGSRPEGSRPSLSSGMAEDPWRSQYPADQPPISQSPRHTSSSSGSAFFPPQSPMQAPRPVRILPSPISPSFPIPPSLPPIGSPSGSVLTPAHTAHLHDLQHQVSVKTLALQTLQHEYDDLLQKLERQRTKCTVLEKKFEATDVEINGLTEEKERLQAHVEALKAQVEELQQSRDEARRQVVANGAQYMKIVEMASRLQAQGAEDKKRWQAEKEALERKIKDLEETQVSAIEADLLGEGAALPTTIALDRDVVMGEPSSHAPTDVAAGPSSESITVLRAEVARLRACSQSLETALRTIGEESRTMQQAVQAVAGSGQRIQSAIDKALDT